LEFIRQIYDIDFYLHKHIKKHFVVLSQKENRLSLKHRCKVEIIERIYNIEREREKKNDFE